MFEMFENNKIQIYLTSSTTTTITIIFGYKLDKYSISNVCKRVIFPGKEKHIVCFLLACLLAGFENENYLIKMSHTRCRFFGGGRRGGNSIDLQ